MTADFLTDLVMIISFHQYNARLMAVRNFCVYKKIEKRFDNRGNK
jgi:hypothetical protein